MSRTLPVVIVVVLMSCACAPGDSELARHAPVTDIYHGVEVTDPYRWLEDWQDPEVREWSEQQNRTARAHLESLPMINQMREQIGEIERADIVHYTDLASRGGRLFALKTEPGLDQALLVVMPSADRPEQERVLVDPNTMSTAGSTTIDWYVPSPDGTLVAVSLSSGGTESGDLHFFDVSSGDRVGRVIPRVQGGTAGGSVAWTRDGSRIFFTRYPSPGERPQDELSFYQQLCSGSWQSDSEDLLELGESFPKIAEIRVATDPSSTRVLLTYQEGDSGRFEFWLRAGDGQWSQLTSQEDRVVQAVWAPDGALFMISRKDAPRGQILRLPSDASTLDQAALVVAEGEDTIVSDFYGAPPLVATASRIWVTTQLGGPSVIRVFDHGGRSQPGPNVPPVSSIEQIVANNGDAILFASVSYLSPRTWHLVDGKTEKMAISSVSPVDMEGVEVVRVMVSSKDGTLVPLNIVRAIGIKLDGSNPTLLTGYGGYSVNIIPRFNPVWAVWLAYGGVYAQANLRGGGEFGEDWHRAGMLTNKQNVFDDFAACMDYLVDAGYTTSQRLAILGGSNGGLLMGAMITQHPEACRTVVSFVGVYDMLRSELSANGVFNIPEYGTVKDPEQFEALLAYSPYHNVSDVTNYPAVLFMTGANDPRVDPMQSRKMTARLQEATSSGLPILLRTSADTGHGGGTPRSARIEEEATFFAFLFDRLGIGPAVHAD